MKSIESMCRNLLCCRDGEKVAELAVTLRESLHRGDGCTQIDRVGVRWWATSTQIREFAAYLERTAEELDAWDVSNQPTE